MAVMNSMRPGVMVIKTAMNMATGTGNVANAMALSGMTLVDMVTAQPGQTAAFGTGCRSRDTLNFSEYPRASGRFLDR